MIESKSNRPAVLILVCVILVTLVITGCSDGKEAVELTKTEKLRLQLSPQIGAFMARSEVAFGQGNYNLAFALLDSVEAFVPDLADVHFMRGRLFTQLNELDLSMRSYQHVLELDPEYVGARFNMGLNAFRRGLLREAVDYYKEEEAINKDPAPVLYLEMGKAYGNLGEPDSARMAYERSIAIDNSNATAYMWLGQLLEEMGDLEGALEYSQKGAQLKPDDPDYEYIIGSLYFRMGELEKAIEYLEPVAKELEWHQGAQYNLGQALMRTGREEEAQFYLVRADSAQQRQQTINEAVDGINSEPGNRDKWVELATLLWESGQKERAVESYKTAVNIDPTNFAMQSNLASMLVESGDVEAGIERFERILRLRPDLVQVHINLGGAYANEGRFEEARATWERALELEPNNRMARNFIKQLESMEEAGNSQ